MALHIFTEMNKH